LDESLMAAYLGVGRAIRTAYSFVDRDEQIRLRERVVAYRGRAASNGATEQQLHWIDYAASVLDSHGHTALESKLRQRIASGGAGPEEMLRYGVLLGSAGLFEESYDYFAPARASPELAWGELDLVGVQAAQRGLQWSIPARRNLLTRHSEQVGHLTALAVALAKIGEFKEARAYLRRAQDTDTIGKWSFYTECAVRILAGEVSPGTVDFEQVLADSRGTRLCRGQLCFIAGDVSRGCGYWRELVGSGLSAASAYHRDSSHCFADGVVQHADYQDMLDEIGIGRRWTAFLRECVDELAPVTGIELRPAA
jgi:tetratricopeptide (TPR) repeat protein